MARPRKVEKVASRKRTPTRVKARSVQPTQPSPAPGHFVGREGSPVLEKYPTKAMDAAVGEVAAAKPAPSKVSTPAGSPRPPAPSPTPLASPPGVAVPASGAAPKMLISLEKPFDVDDFSQLLGQTQIQVTVPRDSLAEVLRRACDFMGFGIYVYTIRVRPGPEELLKTYIVELQRVDYSPEAKDWAPFQERGKADSPFGPTGTR
jgi:hypothetical protein